MNWRGRATSTVARLHLPATTASMQILEALSLLRSAKPHEFRTVWPELGAELATGTALVSE
jgi:hypothetical protein